METLKEYTVINMTQGWFNWQVLDEHESWGTKLRTAGDFCCMSSLPFSPLISCQLSVSHKKGWSHCFSTVWISNNITLLLKPARRTNSSMRFLCSPTGSDRLKVKSSPLFNFDCADVNCQPMEALSKCNSRNSSIRYAINLYNIISPELQHRSYRLFIVCDRSDVIYLFTSVLIQFVFDWMYSIKCTKKKCRLTISYNLCDINTALHWHYSLKKRFPYHFCKAHSAEY